MLIFHHEEVHAVDCTATSVHMSNPQELLQSGMLTKSAGAYRKFCRRGKWIGEERRHKLPDSMLRGCL